MYKKLISFYQRRIKISAKKGDLVLDVGSGDNPHWRADVLLDMYIDDKFLAQRRGNSVVSRPIFDANAEEMPFKDKTFDYVICSHLLEHVENPEKVIQEIMRVGKSGYIEVPFEGSSKITDFMSHLWYCRKENEKIIFTAKKDIIFDNEIEKFVSDPKISKHLSKLYVDNFEKCIVSLHWNESISYEVVGEPNLVILKSSLLSHDASTNFLNVITKRLINIFASYFFFWKRRNEPIYFNQVVKQKFRMKNDKELSNQVYKIT